MDDLIKDDLLELKLAHAINEIAEEAQLPLNRSIIIDWVAENTELWIELKNFLNPLPVPLDIMHSYNICNFHSLYTTFKELSDLFLNYQYFEHALLEYSQIPRDHANTDKRQLLSAWVQVHSEYGGLLIIWGFMKEDDLEHMIYDVNYKLPNKEISAILDFAKAYNYVCYDLDIRPV